MDFAVENMKEKLNNFFYIAANYRIEYQDEVCIFEILNMNRIFIPSLVVGRNGGGGVRTGIRQSQRLSDKELKD